MERKHGFLIVILLLIISGVLAVVTFERSPKAEASEIQQAFMEELKLENPEPCELEWESGTPCTFIEMEEMIIEGSIE